MNAHYNKVKHNEAHDIEFIKTEEEWVEKISKLIEDSNLRKNIGLEGRKTIEESFSLKVNFPKYLEILRKL